MPSVTPRPLRDIVRDLEVRDVKMTKAIAEEAAASVAADGIVSRDEARLLEPYADGPRDWQKDRRDRLPGWTQGSQTGRALFNALATKVSNMMLHAEVHNELVNAPGERSSVDVMNPFTWWTAAWSGGASTTKGAAIEGNHRGHGSMDGTKASFVDDVRQAAIGWLHNSVEDVLRDYPKASVDIRTQQRTPLPQVQVKIDALRADWIAGRIGDQKEIAASLRTYLDANFR
jgi:hypothetical protein